LSIEKKIVYLVVIEYDKNVSAITREIDRLNMELKRAKQKLNEII